MSTLPLLEEALKELAIPYTSEMIDQTAIYLEELLRWNKKINLSGAQTLEALQVHCIDGLLGKSYIDDYRPNHTVDLGSGAGFPAIPLAIFGPESQWTLVERSSKRVGFLRVVTAITGLNSRVSVLEQPAEMLVPDADVVTFRAFRPIACMHETFQGYIDQGATLVLFKGKEARIREELEAHPLGSTVKLYPCTHKLIEGERTICTIHS